ncbi:uncharacterized protein A1O9_07101 [Exophiala aquamarina CBS 119918]|uniref:BTB domain-containing protein n=1 Tax=Exophiala aquamarina CBS 119918 TaxID=1182545 RepID=A0A072PAK6_9EURO|nr:uncharacterized protein A1O9_07101 [Exophiala aquamarina CBS 119918]KEF56911.1 hypothetical protein A1O9_07101 [Exophiala aquamarina CBS 119918]
MEPDPLVLEPNSGTRENVRLANMRFADYVCSPVIELSVGENQWSFNIHKSLLMKGSALFRDYLGRRGNSSKRNMKILPVVKDGRHLEPFVCWLYGNNGSPLDTGDMPAYHIGQLWLVAEEIESTEYRNWLADELQRVPASTEWYLKSYHELCSVGQGGSAIGNFMIHCIAHSIITKDWQELFGDHVSSTHGGDFMTNHQDLLHRLFLAVDTMKKDWKEDKLKDPKDRYDCSLHHHETEDSQESCPRYGKGQVDSWRGTVVAEANKEDDRGKKRTRLGDLDLDKKRVTI